MHCSEPWRPLPHPTSPCADPAKRITIHEIQDHPWYMKDLPPGVKEMNDNMRMPPGGSQVRRLGLVGRAGARAIVTGRACLSPASLFPTSMQLPCPFFTRSAAQHNPPLHHTLLHSRRAVGGGDPSGGAGSAEEQRRKPPRLGGAHRCCSCQQAAACSAGASQAAQQRWCQPFLESSCPSGPLCAWPNRFPDRCQAVHLLRPHPPPKPVQDDYIDDTMDAENYESSFDEWGAT